MDPLLARALGLEDGRPVACFLCGAPFVPNQEWVAYESDDATLVGCPDCLSRHPPIPWTTLVISLPNHNGREN